MQERQLIKLLLKKNFYEKNKGKVSKTTFTNGLGNFYTSIEKAHKDYEDDLTIDDLIDLHTEKYNPALTRAARLNFESLIQEIKDEQEPNEAVATDIIDAVHKRNLAHKVAVIATDIFNGQDKSFNEIKNLLDNVEEKESEKDSPVTERDESIINIKSEE